MNYQPTQGKPSQPSANEPFSAEEAARIQKLLRKKLGPEHVSTRQGMGNSRLSYVEGWRIISIANEIFGFDGWSSSIQSFGIDYMDILDGGRFNIGATCVMRVTLKDNTFREDVGFGMIENAKSKGQALEKVRKEAVTDALKRAMRQFGNVLGNCVYDKEFVRSISQVQKQPRGRVSGETLFRHSDLENAQMSIDGDKADVPVNLPAVSANQFQSAKTVSSNNTGNKQVYRDPEDSMEFDMNDIDDAGVLDMIEDLETQRPVIHESPSFAHMQSPVGSEMQTPRVAGSNPAAAGHMPKSARNLSFRPPPPRHSAQTPQTGRQGLAESRSTENTPDQHRRSFADISPFVPSSAGSNPSANGQGVNIPNKRCHS
ncbi:DNA repair protein rad52 [Coemansia sp. RSA 989]|nr:DNA repair protein rad52 [Coemansia sp. RSA 989]